ncbi:Coenzyme F420 hydrogenase/dehydrogenase, beta subunit C-terminal domain [Nostocoides jenkinsii]|uniref:Putative Coenzyme F420 hydrogenase/dehydrogenase beta subunit domain protein n=1 Tax=Nostocoides jenkinsii Ben 74 TaxID=1193518 RepID=A0A077MB21_9MICO|nr:Coenzyme F420 hydrogenase/dehydrogenase, beta subunit C-terminal domain [Tetrasphaera jenkinsii]CCI52012.1 putative Coenzyme F420 hydrogenase/dehydrogenase beta subunit domain protein [Tetrasphaera jenkinsii Ben 74]
MGSPDRDLGLANTPPLSACSDSQDVRLDEASFLSIVRAGDMCTGCGACAAITGSTLQVGLSPKGLLQVEEGRAPSDPSTDFVNTCPFVTTRSEDDLATSHLLPDSTTHYDPGVGYSRRLLVGHVRDEKARALSSSGGIATWVLQRLLATGVVDSVIHVRPSEDSAAGLHFEYAISSSSLEIADGAKTRYSPVTLARVLETVRASNSAFAVVGVPCFIKAVRLLQEKEPVFAKRIVFTVGLVCGHMKSSLFTAALASEMGLAPGELRTIDYRAKGTVGPASDYNIELTREDGGSVVRPAREMFSYDWGKGLFRYPACDVCDDVLAETADISIGDAWLAPYVANPQGTSIVALRSQQAVELLSGSGDEVCLEPVDADQIRASQAGGLRDRREGLAYRLSRRDAAHHIRPLKRVAASADIPLQRRRIYAQRMLLRAASLEMFLSAGTFDDFVSRMSPLIGEYERLYRPSAVRVRASKAKGIIRRTALRLRRRRR